MSAAICSALSAEYARLQPWYVGGPIKFGSIPEGSKTVAQLAASFNLLELADYITLLDDDTHVPPTWSLDEALGPRVIGRWSLHARVGGA